LNTKSQNGSMYSHRTLWNVELSHEDNYLIKLYIIKKNKRINYINQIFIKVFISYLQ